MTHHITCKRPNPKIKQACPPPPLHSGNLRRHAVACGGTAGGRTLALLRGSELSALPATMNAPCSHFEINQSSHTSHPPPLVITFSDNWWDLSAQNCGESERTSSVAFPKFFRGDVHGGCSYELDLQYDIRDTQTQNPVRPIKAPCCQPPGGITLLTGFWRIE